MKRFEKAIETGQKKLRSLHEIFDIKEVLLVSQRTKLYENPSLVILLSIFHRSLVENHVSND